MQRADPNKLIHVKRVHLANGDTLDDKDAAIISGFLVVAADREDQAPTWYNLNEVTALQEVTAIEGQGRQQGQRVVFF